MFRWFRVFRGFRGFGFRVLGDYGVGLGIIWAADKICCLASGQNSHKRAAISFHLVLHTPEHVGVNISFLLGLTPTDQIYDHLVLQHSSRALNLVSQQVCILTPK